MSTRDYKSAAPGDDAIDAYALRSDTVDLPCKRGVYPVLYVHVAGNVKILPAAPDSSAITIALPIGQYPCRVRRLYSTDTTATAVTGIY